MYEYRLADLERAERRFGFEVRRAEVRGDVAREWRTAALEEPVVDMDAQRVGFDWKTQRAALR